MSFSSISYLVLSLLTLCALLFSRINGVSTFNNRMTSEEFPLCIYNASDLVYNQYENLQGYSVDTYETFLKCLSRISGPKLIPSLNQSEPVEVFTTLELNNIGDIDPVGALVELDFYLRLWWKDPRLNMPAYWESLEIGVKEVHLDRIFYDSAGIFIWRPDIFYHDGLDIKVLGESFFVNASSTIHWQQHVVAVFSQQHFSFEKFPDDTQQIKIRYGSFGYDSTQLQLSVGSNPLSFVPTLGVNDMNGTANGLYNFYLHSEWQYTTGDGFYGNYMTGVNDNDMVNYTDVMFVLPVNRYTNGFVVRLVIPVAIFMVLAGLTFYVSNIETRISSATGLLIAVSALYVVMIDSIPFVGYVTIIDSYVLSMIAILCVTIFVHLVLLTISRTIYTDVVSDELLVKYNQPFTYLMNCLSSLCVETEISMKHKRVAAQCIRGDVARERYKHSASHGSLFTAMVPPPIDLTKEEKEYRKPILTMLVMIVDAAGRTFIVPYTLIFTAESMLTDKPEISEAIIILAYLIITLSGSWELWRGFCKVMEMLRKNIPLSKECDQILFNYLDLKAIAISSPSSTRGSDHYRQIVDDYQRIKSQHIMHLSRQLDYWSEAFLSQDLPSVGFQRTGLIKEARLMEEEDRTRTMIMLVVNEQPNCLDSDVRDEIKQSNDCKSRLSHPEIAEIQILGTLDELNDAYDELYIFVSHLFRTFYPQYQESIAALSRDNVRRKHMVI